MTPAGIRFGLALTNQHALGADLVAGVDGELSLARSARDLGWDGVGVTQHYLSGRELHGIHQVPMLARLITETGDMTLHVGINLLSLHNPVEVAEVFASLDVISGGRLVFGVGLGYRAEEFAAFGLDPRGNVSRFEANLGALIELWTSEAPHIDLPWCRVQGTPLSVRPLQRPRPPIFMAANADSAVERAARLSDGWIINPHATMSTVARQLQLFHGARRDAGLPPPRRMTVAREIYCASTREQALETARPYLGPKYEAYATWGQDQALPGDESFRIPFDLLEQERFVLGSPDDCIAMLLPWRDRLGVDEFFFRTHWYGMPYEQALVSMKLISGTVIPALRASDDRPGHPANSGG